MKTLWKEGELIRNKNTSQPYFVVHVYKGVCTLILDMTQNMAIIPLGVLLERDYGYFAKDIEMEAVKENMIRGAVELEFKALPKIREKKK